MKTDLKELSIACLPPGASVYVGGSCAEPRGLLDAVQTHCQDSSGVIYTQFPLGAVNQRDLTQLTPDATDERFLYDAFYPGQL